MKQERFWVVWNPDGNSPRVKHGSRENADREAARLAKKAPGDSFFVMKAVGGHAASAPKPEPIKMVKRPKPEEIPF